jgi:hypothetical protein
LPLSDIKHFLAALTTTNTASPTETVISETLEREEKGASLVLIRSKHISTKIKKQNAKVLNRYPSFALIGSIPIKSINDFENVLRKQYFKSLDKLLYKYHSFVCEQQFFFRQSYFKY